MVNAKMLVMKLLIVLISLNLSIAISGFSGDPLARQRLDRVEKLPGQNFVASFAHYSGYVTVDEEAGRALFYWFFEADQDSDSKPLLLWLNGGPGCSAIAYGEAEEVGPFHIRPDSKTLFLNPYSWNQAANILFLESPVGVGFSYSNTSSDLQRNGDKRTAKDALQFLVRWFERFPQFKGREFYISGESYAGHFVPQLSQAIVRYNAEQNEKAINLKGYMVGNALTDDHYDQLGVFQFMWDTGVISDQTYKSLNNLCAYESFVHSTKPCADILNIAYEEIGPIDLYSIYTPTCPSNVTQSNQLRKRIHRGRFSQSYDPCTEKHSAAYFNRLEVQQALHVDPNHAPATWITCNDEIGLAWNDSPSTVLDVYRELINEGLRIWVFSGDQDVVLPITSTRYCITALNLTTAAPWRAWYDGGEVGGWTQEYEGLTFVSVRGAAHEVPLLRPKQALTLVKSFLAGSPMPTLGDDQKLVSSSR